MQLRVEAGAPLGRRRVAPSVAAAVLAASALAGAAGALALHALERAAPVAAPPLPSLSGQAVWAAGTRPAPAFSLLDRGDRLLSITSLRGRTLLLVLVGSRCHGCSTLAGQLGWTLERVPAAARPVVLVVGATSAGRGRGSGGSWHWLRGSKARIAAVRRSYGVALRNPRAVLYLIDRRGFERAGFVAPFLPAFLERDLEILSSERAA